MVVRFQFGIMLENGAYLYVVCGFEFFVDCHRFVVVVCMALVLDDDGEGWSSFGQGGGSLEEGGGGGLRGLFLKKTNNDAYQRPQVPQGYLYSAFGPG